MIKFVNRCVEVFFYDDYMEGDVKNVCFGDFVCIRNVYFKEEKNNFSLRVDEFKVMYFKCFILI